MAPIIANPFVQSSAPLADYFFICGIESAQIFEERVPVANGPGPQLDATIEEDRALETDATARPNSAAGLPNVRFSYEGRRSISSTIGLDPKGTASNRSSATIRAVQLDGSGLSDADFEVALRKFASERDSFLEEIHFTAGAVQIPPKPRLKTQRIVNEDLGPSRSAVGSIRRRLSTMNSMKRQPSMVRQCEFKMAHA